MKIALSRERWRHLEHRATSRPSRPNARPPSLPPPPTYTVWARFCFTSSLGGPRSWAQMSCTSFLRLPQLRHHVCVHLHRRSTAIWRQSSLAVWSVIPQRAIDPQERWLRILNTGCGTSRFGPGAPEFSLTDENGCDGIRLQRYWRHDWSATARWSV